eukprot:33041-Chlamydomonas_euryale.AAC.1
MFTPGPHTCAPGGSPLYHAHTPLPHLWSPPYHAHTPLPHFLRPVVPTPPRPQAAALRPMIESLRAEVSGIADDILAEQARREQAERELTLAKEKADA